MRCSGPEQDIGEDQIERRAGADRARPDAVGCNDRDKAAGTIEPDIVARGAHGAGIDVGREHADAQARAAAMASTPLPVPTSSMRGARRARLGLLQIASSASEAAARGAVMAGAESERRLDLDADAVERHAGAVMRAVDDEAPGGDRRQSGEALANPVRRFDAPEAQSRGRRRSGRRLHRRPHGVAVERRAEMDRDMPASAAGIGHAHGDMFGGEAIGNNIADAERRPFIGFQPCNQGRHMGRTYQKALIGYSLSSWSPKFTARRKIARPERCRLFTRRHPTYPQVI